MDYKLKIQDPYATDAAKDVATEVLSRSRNRPNFFNAGELENLRIAKNNYQKKMSHPPYRVRSPGYLSNRRTLTPTTNAT